MDYVIAEIKGKQYKLSADQMVTVPGELGKVGDKLTDVRFLIERKGDKVEIGTPEVSVKASLEVVELGKSEKIRVAKFRSKSRYRRVNGHRQAVTTLKFVMGGTKNCKEGCT